MRDELSSRLEASLEREHSGPGPDFGWVLRRARRVRLLRVATIIVSSIALVGVIAVGLMTLPRDNASRPVIPAGSPSPQEIREGEMIEDMSEREKAEVFAVRALASNELMDPFGERSYGFTYRDDTTETPDGAWQVGFAAMDCAPKENSHTCTGLSGEDPETGNALTDTFVIVLLEGGSWEVVDVEGNMLDDERDRVIGFSLPERDEPSHWELLAISTRSLEGEGEGFSVTARPLWVGPFPTKAPGSVCTISAIDARGNVVAQQLFYLEPPRRQFERAGWGLGRGVPNAQGAEEAAARCRQYTGLGWEVSSGPTLVRRERKVAAVTAELVWRGKEGFTTPARCDARLVDENGDVVWRGSSRVEALWRTDELEDFPYRTDVTITSREGPVDAHDIGRFACRSL